MSHFEGCTPLTMNITSCTLVNAACFPHPNELVHHLQFNSTNLDVIICRKKTEYFYLNNSSYITVNNKMTNIWCGYMPENNEVK